MTPDTNLETRGIQGFSEEDSRFLEEVQEKLASGQMPGLRERPTGWRNAKLYFAAGLGLAASFIAACAAPPKSVDITSTPTPQEAPLDLTPGSSFLPNVSKGSDLPTETPTPVKEKTIEERIEEIRNLQKQALEKGQVKFATPEDILQAGGEIRESNLYPGGERDLYVVLPEGNSVTIPAFVEGKIIRAARGSKTTSLIEIQIDGKIIGINFPATAEIKVKPGQVATLGLPLYTITNNSSIETQVNYEKEGYGAPKGTIGLIYYVSTETSANKRTFGELSLKNLLADANNKPLTLPTT